MKTVTKYFVKNVLFLALLLWHGAIFSQTKTQTQYVAISTGHPSITLTLSHNGVGVECKIVNSNPNVKYDISYAVEYELVCGTDKKTISDKGTVQPNGKMISLSQLMNDCVDGNGKRTANSVRNVRRTSFSATPVMDLSEVDNHIKTAYNAIDKGNFNEAENQLDKAEKLCNYCSKHSSIVSAKSHLAQQKLKAQQEKAKKEAEDAKKKETEEKIKSEQEKIAKERLEAEKKAIEEKIKNEQDEEKRKLLQDEQQKIAEKEAQDKTQLTEKEPPEKEKAIVKKTKTKEEEDRDYKLYLYCLGQYNYVEKLVLQARGKRTNAAWEEARKAYDNYTCYNKVPLNYAWKKEIDNGLMATAVSEAVITTIATLTSTPWTYGYGQFIDAKNSTYYHRFQLGISDSYDETFANLELSIMSNLMKLPTRTLNYTFEADNGSKWNSTQTRQFDDVKIFSVSLGPSLTFWPQKNIYIQTTPEVNLGFNFSDNAPVPIFTAFPAVQGKLGLRFGIVYLSGTLGMLWKPLKVDKSSSFASEKGTINGYNVGTVEGKWVAQKFDDDKWVQHKYWMLSLGLRL